MNVLVRDADRGVDLYEFPISVFKLKDARKPYCKYLRGCLPFQYPRLFGEEPGDGFAFLNVKSLDLDCEIFCACDVVAIVFGCFVSS